MRAFLMVLLIKIFAILSPSHIFAFAFGVTKLTRFSPGISRGNRYSTLNHDRAALADRSFLSGRHNAYFDSPISRFPMSSSSVEPENKEMKGSLIGISLTACRNTIRATTGFSLTALRASLRAATGVSISGIFKAIVGLFPIWARFVFQPFLVMYYTPLVIFRSLIGPTKGYREDAKRNHETIVDGWKKSIMVAEAASNDGYWPLHVNEKGQIEAVLPPDPDDFLGEEFITEAVAGSVEFDAQQSA